MLAHRPSDRGKVALIFLQHLAQQFFQRKVVLGRRVVGFRTVYVFDLVQTDGDALPDLAFRYRFTNKNAEGRQFARVKRRKVVPVSEMNASGGRRR